MDGFLREMDEKYSSYYDQHKDDFDQYLEDSIKSDPDRARLLEVVQSATDFPVQAIFPIEEFTEKRFRYLCSGSFGSAMMLERGRRRLPMVLKIINCLPYPVCYQIVRNGMRYGDVYREIRCMQTLAKLTRGLSIGHQANGETDSNKEDIDLAGESSVQVGGKIFKAACFPQLYKMYLCNTSQALMSFEAFYNWQAGTTTYPTLEKTILLMEHCGVNLHKLLSDARFVAQQMLSVYKQVVLGLVVAERAFLFEHRDMHISNLMVRPSKHRHINFVCDSTKWSIASCGMQAMIIDFTYARLTTENGDTLFKDLSTLFEANVVYEESETDFFDGYKDMHRVRMAAGLHQDWQHFSAGSNLAWIKRFTKEILDQLVANKSQSGHSANKPIKQDLKQRTEAVQSYLAKLLTLACACKTTEQFMAELLTDQYNLHDMVPIILK